jgi:UPF0755 protein
MDIKPMRPFRRNATPNPKSQQQAAAQPPKKVETDDATPLKVPEELLKPGKKVPLIPANTPKRSRLKWWIMGIVGVVIVLIIAAVIGWFWWYNDALKAPSATNQRIRVVIEQGSTPGQIADTLQGKGVIKNSTAFQLLVKQSGDRDKLQAGTYLFSPTQTAKEVLNWLVEGKVDTFNVTILPGQTLAQIKQKLIKDGFVAADIDAAFAKKYDHPLLANKPDTVNLEGYIYPETYQISSETTVEQLLTRTFDQFYSQIQSKGLQAELSAKGFNLHQGITLASIVGKEASHVSDRRQVAQVFEKRLSQGMELGSDVTFMYAAGLTGQTASPDLDSPYNTRKYKGLPPGAIANFTFDALQAVAEPAAGDYLYFVAGDDGTVYFANTEAEHEQNIKQYCTKLCNE